MLLSRLSLFFLLLNLSSCATFPSSNITNEKFLQIYQIMGNEKQIIRAVTSDDQCPFVLWDKLTQQKLITRVESAVIPIRKQSDGIDSNFPVKTCEIIWPKGAKEATIHDQTFKSLEEEINKIVILGDTGCRLKSSENAYQECNDLDKWPFKKIVINASKLNPDLIVHVGDIHYRESPCPENMLGCKNSPWGYGFDTWKADFFDPAKPLLDVKPWVFVRGNHESCQRAGQGWHRFIDEQPWDDKKSCNQTARDQLGNYSAPYAISLGKLAQIIIFNSSNIPSKDLKNEDEAFGIYAQQIRQSENISKNKSFNIFANHHPISIVTPSRGNSENKSFTLNQNSLATIMTQLNQQSLLTPSFSATLHGHIHVSEVIDYQFQRPVSLISGNSGSALEFNDIKKMNITSEQKLKIGVNNIHSYFNFGFATLERKDLSGLSWLFTEYNVDGLEIYSCLISNFNGKSTCADFKKN